MTLLASFEPAIISNTGLALGALWIIIILFTLDMNQYIYLMRKL